MCLDVSRKMLAFGDSLEFNPHLSWSLCRRMLPGKRTVQDDALVPANLDIKDLIHPLLGQKWQPPYLWGGFIIDTQGESSYDSTH